MLSIILTVIFIYLVTWAIDALYQSEYIILSWVLAFVVIFFSLIDLASFFGNVRLDHSSNDDTRSTQDETSINYNVQYDNYYLVRGNTTQGKTTQGNTIQYKTTQGNTTQGNTIQYNTTQGNTDQGNTTVSSFITSPITTSFYSDYISNVASNPYGN